MTRMKSKAQVAQAEMPPQAACQGRRRGARPRGEEPRDRSASRRRSAASTRPTRSGPKRKFVGARATEYRFAHYVDNWRQKIERIGNLNYPEEAKRERHPRLAAAHRGDQGRRRDRVGRDQPLLGPQVLDQAAMRIVRLAAPFEPLPRQHPRRHRHPAHHAHLDLHARGPGGDERLGAAVALLRAIFRNGRSRSR